MCQTLETYTLSPLLIQHSRRTHSLPPSYQTLERHTLTYTSIAVSDMQDLRTLPPSLIRHLRRTLSLSSSCIRHSRHTHSLSPSHPTLQTYTLSPPFSSDTREIYSDVHINCVQPIPLGVTFSKAQSSKLERLLPRFSERRRPILIKRDPTNQKRPTNQKGPTNRTSLATFQ